MFPQLLARPKPAVLTDLAKRGAYRLGRAAAQITPKIEALTDKILQKASPVTDYARRTVNETLTNPNSPLKLTPAAALMLQTLALAVAEREASAPSAPNAPAKPKTPWLISQKDDLTYLLGSSTVSYAAMAALFLFKVPPRVVWWTYVLFFDAPHVFGTFSRTYADPDEWQRRRRLFLGSLLWFVPGPLAAKFGLHKWFDLFAYTWAYYHLVKQHYGFSVLYKKKNNDLEKLDNYLDKALIWTGFTMPYVRFMFSKHYPQGYLRTADVLPAWLPKATTLAFGGTLAAYLARQAYKVANGKPLNAPKQLLLANSIGMHVVAFRLPWSRLGSNPTYNLAALQAVLTLYHNVQYNRLIWFHNQNKYVKGIEKGNTFGFATALSKNLPRYCVMAFLFGIGYRLPLTRWAQGRWGAGQKYARYAWGVGWGFAFVHYYLDSKIWRVRSDARLNKALQTGK